MTVRDAYRSLDLAPGLGKDRVESQFHNLTIDLKNRLSQSKSPNLQTFYASRLKEIEAAKAILDQHFAPNEAKVMDESDDSAIDQEVTDFPVDSKQATDDTASESNAPSENSQDPIAQEFSFSYEGESEELDKNANFQSEVNPNSTETVATKGNGAQLDAPTKNKFLRPALIAGGILLTLIFLYFKNQYDQANDPFRHLPNEKYVLVNKLHLRAYPNEYAYSLKILSYGTRIIEVESGSGFEKGLMWSRVAVFNDASGWEQPDTGFIAVSECGQPWVVDSASYHRFHAVVEDNNRISGMTVQKRYALVNYLNSVSLEEASGLRLSSNQSPDKFIAFQDFTNPRAPRNCKGFRQGGFATILEKSNDADKSKLALFWRFGDNSEPILAGQVSLDSNARGFDTRTYQWPPFCYHDGLVLLKYSYLDVLYKDTYYYFDSNQDLVSKTIPN